MTRPEPSERRSNIDDTALSPNAQRINTGERAACRGPRIAYARRVESSGDAPCAGQGPASATALCGGPPALKGARRKPLASISTTPRTASPTRTLQLLIQLGQEAGRRQHIEAMFRGEPRGASRCPTSTARRLDRRSESRAGGPCRPRQDGTVRAAGARRRLEALYRQAHPQRGPTRPWRPARIHVAQGAMLDLIGGSAVRLSAG
jgi:hypothetical protein